MNILKDEKDSKMCRRTFGAGGLEGQEHGLLKGDGGCGAGKGLPERPLKPHPKEGLSELLALIIQTMVQGWQDS